MSAVHDLREAVGWSAPDIELDWAGVEDALGLRLPSEFRELCEAFPPGEFQTFLKVLHPSAESDPAAYATEVSGYAALLGDDAAERGFPYPLYPAPGGVVPWATIGFDYVIGWLADAGVDSPDAWPVIVCESRLAQWHLTGLSTGGFMRAITTVPPVMPVLGYVAEAAQPPDFTPAEPVAGVVDERHPRPGYWLEGEPPTAMAEPHNAVDELRSLIPAAPPPTRAFDWSAVDGRMERALPVDYNDLVDAFGAVTVGPATVIVPDGSATGFFAELKRLGNRVAADRAAGGGPIGTVHPETDGLIQWARLSGGGRVCWVPVSYDPEEWPVIVLDDDLRFAAVHHMSASRFLLELATHPERIVLPPAL
jgi:hypothetical protein